MSDDDLKDIEQPAAYPNVLTAAHALHGRPIPPQQQVLLYSPAEWESFIEEWAFCCLKQTYTQVQRFAGAGDRGIDIAGFTDSAKLQGVWDNYQCKHYDHALHPGDAWPEIGKVLWYSFTKHYRAPRRYYFTAPFGVGTALAGLLSNAEKLKSELIAKWDTSCRTKITKTQDIPLEGDFRAYVDAFDFSIFDAKTALQVVDDHRHSPYHAARFGGGLPPRPLPGPPPADIAPAESRYVAQLLEAYADNTNEPVADMEALKKWPRLQRHFVRQREAFYHAEDLRVFSRDSVPPGTFEALQENIYTGVIDAHDADHPCGYTRVCKVTEAARELQITANALISCTDPKDRDGICHQLANEDRLQWTKS